MVSGAERCGRPRPSVQSTASVLLKILKSRRRCFIHRSCTSESEEIESPQLSLGFLTSASSSGRPEAYNLPETE
ncbi:hypothetical protein QJS10_CPB21g00297 [Acorus calamus]|uniref:Uncharacterized protein n=1 Tax=Acorus calamus TaxID=4465 RepID=A0AAV9C8V4_ACOCL|nr:hypothetical protein QJS10_CPB21g00297 [Acorus calamus]